MLYEDEDWEVKLRVLQLVHTLFQQQQQEVTSTTPYDALTLFFKLKGDKLLVTAVSDKIIFITFDFSKLFFASFFWRRETKRYLKITLQSYTEPRH